MLVQLKRGFLIVLLSLTGLAVLACVGAIVLGSGGKEEELAMLSGLTWGYLLTLAFAAFYVIDRGAAWLKAWAVAGLVFVALAVVVMPVYFWWETYIRYSMSYSSYSEMHYGEWASTLMIVTSWTVLVPAVLTPRIRRGSLVQLTTAASMSVAAGISLYMIWARGDAHDAYKVLEVALILSGAGSLGVVVLNRFMAIKVPDVLSSVQSMIWLRCPRCMKEQEMRTGESRCGGCGLKFKLEVEEPRCGKCGYNLHGLTRPVCPECGNMLRFEDVVPAAEP